jgi:hypothetical protein
MMKNYYDQSMRALQLAGMSERTQQCSRSGLFIDKKPLFTSGTPNSIVSGGPRSLKSSKQYPYR